MNCPDCDGTGYQNLIGQKGSAGRCETCEAALVESSKEAARVILGGFVPKQRNNQDWIEEAATIIRREIKSRMITIARKQ